MTIGHQSFGLSPLRPVLFGATLLAIAAAPPAGAVHVRATVNSHVTGINAIGGTIIGVGPAPSVDFSGTDVAGLDGLNPYDQSSFMANGCTTGTSLCNDVRILIGGYIDIDTVPSFAVVAPRIEPQDVATFIFSAAGTLELNLDTNVLWGENLLSGLPGAGISRYSFGEWQLIGPGGFAFGPSRSDATGEFALAQVLSFDLAPGTYQLVSPAVSIFLCAESPADGFCGATQVPAPASLALLAAGLLGLLALRTGRRAVPVAVAAMLAAGIMTAPAQAALYQFKFLFDEGPLAGNQYTGSFQTGSDTGPGIYYPDHLNPSYRLLTFDVTIGAVSFDKFDDVNPPGNPVVIIGNDLMNLMANRIDFHTADDAIPYLFIWLINSDEDFNIVSFRANASDDLSRGRIISITQGFDDFAIPPNSPEGQRLFDLLGPDGLRARFPIPVEANAVPAPASLILLGASLSLLAAARRFRTNRRRTCLPRVA